MKLNERIKKRRLELGLSRQDLALRCGWDDGASRISNYENGIRQPTLEVIQRLAYALETSISWLISGNNEANPIENLFNSADNSYKLRVIPVVKDQFIKNLDGQLFEFSGSSGKSISKIGKVATIDKVSQYAFAIVVNNDSMTADRYSTVSFPQNTVIIVDPMEKAKNNSFVLAQIHSTKELAFRQYKIDIGNAYLFPLNSQYSPITLTKDDRIIGVVMSSIQHFHTLPFQDD